MCEVKILSGFLVSYLPWLLRHGLSLTLTLTGLARVTGHQVIGIFALWYAHTHPHTFTVHTCPHRERLKQINNEKRR